MNLYYIEDLKIFLMCYYNLFIISNNLFDHSATSKYLQTQPFFPSAINSECHSISLVIIGFKNTAAS
ncbi:hypothetical protein MASR2M54_12300 [Aliarcobacter cryaerophilus]